MSLAANFCALRVSFGLAALVAASALYGCGLDTGGVLAGQSAGGTGAASATSAGSGGGEAASSSGAGGGSGGMGGGGGGMPAGCGDGIVTPPEMCDDNNNNDGDACTANCSCGADHPDVIAFPGPGDGHCYLHFKISKGPLEALADCKAVGAYGATITTEKERIHIGGHLSQTVWIGGTDFQFFGPQEWAWENGEPWLINPCDSSVPGCDNAINFWSSKEPNGDTDEDCLELLGDIDRFNDASCFNTLPFLCEKSP